MRKRQAMEVAQDLLLEHGVTAEEFYAFFATRGNLSKEQEQRLADLALEVVSRPFDDPLWIRVEQIFDGDEAPRHVADQVRDFAAEAYEDNADLHIMAVGKVEPVHEGYWVEAQIYVAAEEVFGDTD